MEEPLNKIKKGVLFVCYANGCRSIMAEAIARRHYGEFLNVASAGIRSLPEVPEYTLAVLNEVGVSCEGLYSKSIDEIHAEKFEVIVNLADVPVERYLAKDFTGKIIDSYVSDPYGRGPDAYRQTRDAIERLIIKRISQWLGDDDAD